jgi:hypothetical protein
LCFISDSTDLKASHFERLSPSAKQGPVCEREMSIVGAH